MKNFINYSLPIMATAAILTFFASCDKTKETAKTDETLPSLQTESFTPCHSNQDPEAKSLTDQDSVVVTYNNGTILVTHFHLTVPCDFTTVGARIAQNNDTIRVYEHSDGGNVNCICKTDHTFRITNVKGTRTLILENCYPMYCQTFDFQ